MVKEGGALARVTSICPGAATGVSADATSGSPPYGSTRCGGNKNRLSTPWREVISLAGLARSFSIASSYRSFSSATETQCQIRSQEARYAKRRRKRSRSEW